MPSQKHESRVFLFQNEPDLAPELIQGALGGELPPYDEARLISADLSQLQPTEYRADVVVELREANRAVYAIVVEVQLRKDEDKPFVWPVYVTTLRERLRCPVSLLVVTPSKSVARWASQRVQIDPLSSGRAYVLGHSAVPEVTDQATALRNPEPAVLSAMAHGRDVNTQRALEIAMVARKASVGLDAERSGIYCDLILNSLGRAARAALKDMDSRTYVYKSDFARHYIAVGKRKGVAEGEASGRASLVTRQLARRFGKLNAAAKARVRNASIAELDAIGERLLTATNLREALGPKPPR